MISADNVFDLDRALLTLVTEDLFTTFPLLLDAARWETRLHRSRSISVTRRRHMRRCTAPTFECPVRIRCAAQPVRSRRRGTRVAADASRCGLGRDVRTVVSRIAVRDRTARESCERVAAPSAFVARQAARRSDRRCANASRRTHVAAQARRRRHDVSGDPRRGALPHRHRLSREHAPVDAGDRRAARLQRSNELPARISCAGRSVRRRSYRKQR